MKKYIGKRLKAPYDDPQFKTVTNPEKEPITTIGKTDLRWLKNLLGQCNDLPVLEEVNRLLEERLDEAFENFARPSHIEELQWPGLLQRESPKCGKPTCTTCPHGPYWYCYTHLGAQTDRVK